MGAPTAGAWAGEDQGGLHGPGVRRMGANSLGSAQGLTECSPPGRAALGSVAPGEGGWVTLQPNPHPLPRGGLTFPPADGQRQNPERRPPGRDGRGEQKSLTLGVSSSWRREGWGTEVWSYLFTEKKHIYTPSLSSF